MVRKMIKKINETDELVTKGYLRQEFLKLNERFEKFGQVILDQMTAMVAEQRDFRLRMEHLDRLSFVHEQKIDDLEERFLVLEIPKQIKGK
jgi:hypothetical protein